MLGCGPWLDSTLSRIGKEPQGVDKTEAPILNLVNSKGLLQEYLQGFGLAMPEYRVVEKGGEAHKPVYTMGCKIALLDEEFIATSGNKRAAEQMAAEKCLAAALG